MASIWCSNYSCFFKGFHADMQKYQAACYILNLCMVLLYWVLICFVGYFSHPTREGLQHLDDYSNIFFE